MRRFGRFGIAILSLVAFFAAAAIVYFATALTLGVLFPKLTILAGFAAAIGVYRIIDKLGMMPDDPDKLITLSLTTLPANQDRWVSSDFEK